MPNQIYVSVSTDPYHNLAVEELLFDACGENRILYIWQNADTVVIGRNQNAWSECRVAALENDGVRLARRKTGGGAVFHDLGNLNFTFIASEGAYDLARQMRVLLGAAAALGVEARVTGRNDITLTDGRKFSGNAFRSAHGVKLHHGTILIDTDGGKMERYLSPSKEKLSAKGVDSVRARVGNLRQIDARITPERMAEALQEAFSEEFGAAVRLPVPAQDARLPALTAFYASWDWRVGASPVCDLRYAHRFPWGGAELLLTVRAGRVEQARVFSDALDQDAVLRLAPAITGAQVTAGAIAERLLTVGGDIAADVAAYLRSLDQAAP